MSDLVLKKITKVFPDNTLAVSNLDLEVQSGEFMVLVGPSGCGKSTTLSMIAGLEEPSSGEIYIDKKLINTLQPKDRDIAMVFQNYALYPHMTVYENMAFSLKLRKWEKSNINKRVQEAANILELDSYLDRYPKSLSGGQRQRVALGRAIVRKPKVFLFDEPLSNLDAKMRAVMRVELKKLHDRLGATMIYVTHDQTEAMTLGQRICIMNNGEIQQLATPIEAYKNPNNLFVASFIGSPQINLIDGEIILKQDQYHFSSDLFKIPINKKYILNQIHKNQAFTIGIRPESLKVFQHDNEDCLFQGNVDLIEPMGRETFAYIVSNNHRITAIANLDDGLNVGDKISLVFDEKNYSIFNKQSGKAIFNSKT